MGSQFQCSYIHLSKVRNFIFNNEVLNRAPPISQIPIPMSLYLDAYVLYPYSCFPIPMHAYHYLSLFLVLSQSMLSFASAGEMIIGAIVARFVRATHALRGSL